MTEIYPIYQNMERDDIILSFKGDITPDLLSSVYQIMETRLDNAIEDIRRKKKFYHILVECLQNVYHHMESLNEKRDVEESEGDTNSAIFIIAKGEEGGYKIITGNFILSENVNDLKVKLDTINEMNPEQLKSYYLEKLSTSEMSEKGTAGLGIIDIARKSGHKMQYAFDTVSQKYSFFSLSVIIK